MTVFIDLFWIVALVLGAPVIAWKLATVPRWRVGILERFGLRPPARKSERPVIWVHAVSVGEVLAARPLVRELEAALPGYDVAISAITSTGLEVARRHMPENLSFFYPIDISFSVQRVLDAVKPSMIVLVELELWPTFLTLARNEGIPIVLVNGRISERSFRRYKLVRRLLTRPIRRFCVQTEEYARRFLGMGVPPERILITGNLKYDTPALDAGGDPVAVARTLRGRLGIAEGAPVLVAGSTHPSEELSVLAAWRALRATHPGLRLVLGPRHTERVPGLLEELARAGAAPSRLTELDARPLDRRPEGEPVVVIDTMGELARLYLVADAVFVGGSLIPHGGQNMLEPAALGKPVVFGPHVKNFQAIAQDLLAAGGATQILDATELAGALGALLGDAAKAREMGERGRAFVERHRGAAKRTVEVIVQALATEKARVEAKRLRREAARTGGAPIPPLVAAASEASRHGRPRQDQQREPRVVSTFQP